LMPLSPANWSISAKSDGEAMKDAPRCTLSGVSRGRGGEGRLDETRRLTHDHRPVGVLRKDAAVGEADEDEVAAGAEELEVRADGEVRVVWASASSSG
jgi:hypothetical protein